MKNGTPTRLFALGAAALVFPALAHAHSSQTLVYDCASGLAHPLHGWDHLLAMIAVGFWAMQLGGRARWMVPAAFVSVMMCAAAVGARGVNGPGLEPLLATSVLVFGLLIATAARLPLVAGLTIVSLFAAAHGFAHGAEIPANAGVLPYAAGFALATIALQAFGLGLGHQALRGSHLLPRVLGAACTAAGAALLFA